MEPTNAGDGAVLPPLFWAVRPPGLDWLFRRCALFMTTRGLWVSAYLSPRISQFRIELACRSETIVPASTAEPVANPGFGEDVLWPGGIWLDFISKMGNEHAQVVRLISIVRSPYCLQQFPVRNWFPGMQNQVPQKVELLRRQANEFLARPDLPRFK